MVYTSIMQNHYSFAGFVIILYPLWTSLNAIIALCLNLSEVWSSKLINFMLGFNIYLIIWDVIDL